MLKVHLGCERRNMLKVHLGCGKRHIVDFINVDIQKYGKAVDVVCDITKDLGLVFEKNSIDLIYSSAVLEHFDRQSWKKVLKHWLSFLKKGGELQLSTVDFDAVCKRYRKEKNIEELVGLLLGGSKDSSFMDRHGMIFNFDYLKEELEKIGYINVKKCHWRNFEPYKTDEKFDDFSRAYLPHMDFENGMLMVLNVKAFKPIGKSDV